MAGRKKTPCEFCEFEGNYINEDVDSLSLTVEVYPEEEFIGVSLVGVSKDEKEVELMYQLPMHYCPNCGRKLEW